MVKYVVPTHELIKLTNNYKLVASRCASQRHQNDYVEDQR